MNSNSKSVSSAARVLPVRPNLECLKNEAKKRLGVLRATAPEAQLADAQFQLAREYGFSSWRDLKIFVDKQSNRDSGDALKNENTRWLGDWIGELGKDVRIALHIVSADNGALHATVDSVDVGQFDLTVNGLSTADNDISFGVYIPSATGNYEATYSGHWDNESESLQGEWLAHGVAVPFVFKRGVFPSAPIVEGIDGFWDGTLQAKGRYRLTFQVKTDKHGTFAWLDSPDRNSYGMPVTSITRVDRQITFTMRTATVSGLLEDDQTLHAQFIRSDASLPVTLTRRPRGAGVPISTARSVVDVPLETLKKYVGVYSFGPEGTLTITIDGNDLYAQFANQPSIQLFAASPTEFFWKQFEASLAFEVVDDKVAALEMRKNGRSSRANHISVSTDPIMAEIMSAAAILRRGDRVGARKRLEVIWSRIADSVQPIHECVLAHSMADAQDDIKEELAWDIRALHAALRCTDDDARRHSEVLSIAAFMPSLHVNLAEDYFKLGDVARSKEHLDSARTSLSALPDNDYAKTIRRGIEGLAKKL